MIQRKARAGLLLLGLALLSACATGPAPVSPESPEARESSASAPTPALPTSAPASTGAGVTPGSSPVDNLLDEARRLRKAGDFSASFARLERALRISPERAEVYLELARGYAALGNAERASASAERGLLYCSGQSCRALRRFIDS